MRSEVAGGVGYWINAHHRIEASGLFGYKAAEKRYLAHHTVSAGLDHSWLLGDGAFLQNHVGYAVRLYRVPDPAVTGNFPQRRREHPLRLRVTYGAPAGMLLNRLGYHLEAEAPNAVRDFLDDVTVSVSAEYLKQQSNIRNFEYENMRGQFLMTKRIEF